MFVFFVYLPHNQINNIMRHGILSYFCTMKDPRIDRKKLHPMENIIFITIAAILCGAETWEDLEDFGYDKLDWLSGILDMKNGVPSHDTFNRFFSALDPGVFETHFIAWTQSIICDHKELDFVSIDGKTIRQASKRSDNGSIHIVSAWSNRNEVTLGQIKTDEKSNEITAIPQLLEVLLLENSVITIDAMGCQKDIAKKIIDKGADYLLAVKGNHPTLEQDIMNSFSLQKVQSSESTFDFGHGRIEHRKYSVISNLKYISQKEEWAGLKSIIRVDTVREHKKSLKQETQTRYYIGSLTDCKAIAQGIRAHWGIENKLHWTLDMVMNEDKSAKRAGYAAQNFSMVNKIALNILRKEEHKISLRRKRKRAGWNGNFLWSMLELTLSK